MEGYGGWAFRMEIVPIESAYPGFGELVVSFSTYHSKRSSSSKVSKVTPYIYSHIILLCCVWLVYYTHISALVGAYTFSLALMYRKYPLPK